MRKVLFAALLTGSLIGSATSAAAATPAEFHANLLRRGIAEYESGTNDQAATHLRLAAFGFIDSIEHYQTAHVYLALVSSRLGQTDRARDSVQRVLQAERIERRFGSIALPAEIRNAFQQLAARLTTAADLETLRSSPKEAPATAAAAAAVQTKPVVPGNAAPAQSIPAATGTAQPAPRPAPPAQAAAPQTHMARPATEQPVRPPQSAAAPHNGHPGSTAMSSASAKMPPAGVSPAELAQRLAAADRALSESRLDVARRIYRDLGASRDIPRATLIQVAEGLYRARDFGATLGVFERVGPLAPGEEMYRYYIAVAAFETAQYARAKRELAAALPHIDVTPEVEAYRARIESAAKPK